MRNSRISQERKNKVCKMLCFKASQVKVHVLCSFDYDCFMINVFICRKITIIKKTKKTINN